MTISMKPQDLIGHDVFDPEGERIGQVESVYIGEQSHEPEWVTVRTGLFGTRESFVPLSGAHEETDGLRVGVTKSLVKDAPHIDSGRTLTEQEGMDLRRHYGLPMQRGSTGPVSRPGGQQPGQTVTGTGMTDPTMAQGGMAGRPTGKHGTDRSAMGMTGTAPPGSMSNPTATDPRLAGSDPRLADRTAGDRQGRADTARTGRDDTQTVIRSEERLKVGKENVEAGHVRLRKHVETEKQQVTVPLSHEEVRIEREPITEADAARLTGETGDLADSEIEMTLYEERPVVSKERVAVEKLRISKEQVTEERTITDEIHKEKFDVVDDRQPGGKPKR
ncbi:conserved domain-containing protein [Actinokineospora alba]|uniref:Conserved domain-containing protein n=1 Tax=Actinokineospora alba TaxID=504798 RepID=A0A1H0N875_9PSEU|nr:PRC and DUF2382 domain-containing protein [Actinokineospora alba]TDP68617.1 uncharacterized protein (TIGR02271 family) [Actinokineospora alba]SDH82924.1 conserved domain-containing protein [Actinokineospora alba]SDO88929.1 conserved domain-containing protein [Actinokineospora alba]